MKRIMQKIHLHFKRHLNKYEIDINELRELEKKGAILIDVRSPQEYKEGHLNNAILIPEYDINKKILDKFNINDEIILYCSTGNRSRKAKKKMEKMGYIKVYNLRDGIN